MSSRALLVKSYDWLFVHDLCNSCSCQWLDISLSSVYFGAIISPNHLRKQTDPAHCLPQPTQLLHVTVATCKTVCLHRNLRTPMASTRTPVASTRTPVASSRHSMLKVLMDLLLFAGCVCNILGTYQGGGDCDHRTGQCPCLPNVIGLECDRCATNHWRIASGTGCDYCDCDPSGSFSQQCNEVSRMSQRCNEVSQRSQQCNEVSQRSQRCNEVNQGHARGFAIYLRL